MVHAGIMPFHRDFLRLPGARLTHVQSGVAFLLQEWNEFNARVAAVYQENQATLQALAAHQARLILYTPR